MVLFFFFSSRRRHTRCALVTGVQTCALPISSSSSLTHRPPNRGLPIGVSRHAPDITVRRRATKARPIFLQFAPPAGADDDPLRRQVKAHDSLKAKSQLQPNARAPSCLPGWTFRDPFLGRTCSGLVTPCRDLPHPTSNPP